MSTKPVVQASFNPRNQGCKNSSATPEQPLRLLYLSIIVLVSLLTGATAPALGGGGWVDVREYFPDNWQEAEQLDLREFIQEAVEANARVFFPGGNDAGNPILYHVSPTVEVPPNHQLKFAPHHRVVRLPSTGRLFILNDNVRMKGAVIDGNKYNHWPEFPDLGKEGDAAVNFTNRCIIKDVVVFNNPGHAFSSRGDYNKIYRCRAENIGYIDVKYNEFSYASRYDGASADGFYLRGTGNLVKDSEAYDCIRWDFCSSHSGARQNTYVDCRGGDINFVTYGFIDIEGAEGNNRLVRCISPNSRIVACQSPQTDIVQCMSSMISTWGRGERQDDGTYAGVNNHAPLIKGNITTTEGRFGGIEAGGWEDTRPGVDSPIVVNNRMYKNTDVPASLYTHWSFSVYSTDGHGVVADNLLFELDDGETRGSGMKLRGVEGHNNQVIYGKWEMDLPQPVLEWGYIPE